MGAPTVEWFTDRAAAAGLDFVHVNGATGRFYYPEILGAGVAMFDYDNDGDLDVYLVQGGVVGAAVTTPMHAPGTGGRLFRNDLSIASDGTRALRFADVTAASGIDARGFGFGVATGDVDNDGCVDLYLTRLGGNQLYRNNCDGTFRDVTARSGTADPGGVVVSAAFLDYDRDGWLDLYVGHNVNYTLAREQVCPNKAGAPDYCPPEVFGGQADRLFRNAHDGTFVDVSGRALVGAKLGPALGVTTADFNGDGWIDIYVANDGRDNLLWINQRDGTFRETALAAGAALTADGKAEASMGVDAGDFDNDGDEDLIMTELTGEGSNLYLNDGAGLFRDVSAQAGLAAISLPYTGWGTGWFDYDNDGWLDLVAANGTIVTAEGRDGRTFPYDQKKLLLRNNARGRLENTTAQAGTAFTLSESGRGVAFGDVDNDGDTDLLVGNDAGPVRLLINEIGHRRHWLGLRLLGSGSTPRDLLGARVGVVRSGGPTLWRRARADGSYASASDPRVLVGLGDSSQRPTVQVRWPDGTTETWPDVPIDRYTTLTHGASPK